ncbi:dihydrofolate reductase [Candidatus Pacearchaeota archaeon]|nr:dihydrofolate reductase [Candidatus Pacearchaeota archaeon]
MDLIIIAAIARNNVIGNNSEIPWFEDDEIRKADMKHFRSLTFGHPIIFGRVTYESILQRIGKPLEGRTNIVVSGRGIEHRDEVIVCKDIFDAMDYAQKLDNIVFIGGGERIYRQTIPTPHVTRLEITEIKGNYIGNKHFPIIFNHEWKEEKREDHERYNFVTYFRHRQNS